MDVLTPSGKETTNKLRVEPPLMYTRLELTPTELHAKNFRKTLGTKTLTLGRFAGINRVVIPALTLLSWEQWSAARAPHDIV